MIRIAVLADPHLHDTRWPGGDVVRSLGDSCRSTRVFNESGAALDRALAQIGADRADICLIVGDLTDDGQSANWAAARARLAAHTARFGTRFFLTPGNHDQWGTHGKPLSKGCVDAEGRLYSVPREGDAADLHDMRMIGLEEAMHQGAAFGYRPDPRDLHWETPFGRSAEPEDRCVSMTGPTGAVARVPDASYLVEPVPDLWLLSIDANVYRPDGQGGFIDHGKEGWIATLAHKPHLLPWMRDVATRARQAGKQLVTFSHYPVADIFGNAMTAAQAAGRGRRMPEPEVTARIAATGIGLHFSGHWHVDALAEGPGVGADGALLNVAVPSTVALPAGWKLLEIGAGGWHLHDRPLGDAPGWDCASPRYRVELRTAIGTAADELDLLRAVAEAPDYPAFLDRHFRAIVLNRRLDDDWPPGLRPLLEVPLSMLPGLFGQSEPLQSDLPLREIFVDVYRLREAGGGPAAGLSPDRRDLCTQLAARFAKSEPPASEPADRPASRPAMGLIAPLIRMLAAELAIGSARNALQARLDPPS
ncbi:metallophosphoesterase family protein [Flavimaricola marinus]|uniref:Calcineurin-like phosphoesterase n=1 Tax=Flavimaricola marinus TaxID=1819565 RepID=A0A238LA80_9RHOB|nr:metallophosphoesterase [Flavimaricola marinus]SMY06324.1 Calcineurin-like phosphoesterase [Flavimaricola marinus]